MKSELVVQSLATHRQTISSPPLSSKRPHASPLMIPNDAVLAIHGLLAGRAQTSERLAAVPLEKLSPSPFYNMLADDKHVDKALVLLLLHQSAAMASNTGMGSASSPNASKMPLLVLLQSSRRWHTMLH